MEREREFLAVDFSNRAAVLEYRRAREERERPIPRHDPGIYVCPFFGPVPPGTGTDGHATPGCMIHPVLTGDETSQNYSFYGASICQGYDCQNKEADEAGDYAATLTELCGDWEEYGRLMGDVFLHKTLRKVPGLLESLRTNADVRAAFAEFCRARLTTEASRRVTSFELPIRPYPSVRAELLDLLEDARGADAEERGRLVARLLDCVPDDARTVEP